jgi:hypothetical protein
MREYSSTISLAKNARGIYSLDTILGCSSGMDKNPKGCFGDVTQQDTRKSTDMILVKMFFVILIHQHIEQNCKAN